MKKNIISFVVGLLTQQVLHSQGITYLSSLGQASAGSLGVGSNSWYAVWFQTGNSAGGYTLDSIQLGMTNATGNPSGFTAMIYSVVWTSAPVPGTNLSTLTGSTDPSTSGIYTYTPASSLILSPNAIYFLVLTAGTAVANGAYEWNWAYPSTSYNPSGNWAGGGHEFSSSFGSSWGFLGGFYPQYAINAEGVPEPGVLSLFVLGGLCFLWHRRKANTVR
jgi:hypothetical protein